VQGVREDKQDEGNRKENGGPCEEARKLNGRKEAKKMNKQRNKGWQKEKKDGK
jgi:hypothetical protein